MQTRISMLRGINVSGQKKIQMVELKGLYEALGFTNVRTYVQSGNVLFDSHEPDANKLAGLIEARLEQYFISRVPVFIRTPEEFQRIITANPFFSGRLEDPSKLHVTFLYNPPSEVEINGLSAPETGGDEYLLGNQEIYLFCPNGYGRTKLSNSFFERKLNQPATTRNWNTVTTLYAMAIGEF